MNNKLSFGKKVAVGLAAAVGIGGCASYDRGYDSYYDEENEDAKVVQAAGTGIGIAGNISRDWRISLIGKLIGFAGKGMESERERRPLKWDPLTKTYVPIGGIERFSEELNGLYEGELKDGLSHGSGIYKYPDGGFYDGRFELGNREGKGIYILPSGEKLQADWHEGKPVGGVLLTYFDGKTRSFIEERQNTLPTGEQVWRDEEPSGEIILLYGNGRMGKFKETERRRK